MRDPALRYRGDVFVRAVLVGGQRAVLEARAPRSPPRVIHVTFRSVRVTLGPPVRDSDRPHVRASSCRRRQCRGQPEKSVGVSFSNKAFAKTCN